MEQQTTTLKDRTDNEAAILLRLAKEGVPAYDLDRRLAEELEAQTKAHIRLIFGEQAV